MSRSVSLCLVTQPHAYNQQIAVNHYKGSRRALVPRGSREPRVLLFPSVFSNRICLVSWPFNCFIFEPKNRWQLPMILDQATKLITSCAAQMDSRYKKIVFDEWAIVSMAEKSKG